MLRNLLALSIRLLPALLLSFLLAQSAAGAEVRTWTDSTGRFTIVAELLDIRGEIAVLRRTDGEISHVPLSRLSQADRQYLSNLIFKNEPPPAPQSFFEPYTLSMEIGMRITAGSAPLRNLRASFPVPIDWPEQKVTIVGERKPNGIGRFRYAVVDDGVKQAMFTVPSIRAGESIDVMLELQIERLMIEHPDDEDVLNSLCVPERPNAALRKYLVASPQIEIGDPRLKQAAESLEFDSSQPAWPQIERIYDWVWEKVEPSGTKPIEGAVAALTTGCGDCEERTSLFVAMCRLNGIPARSVWIPRHTYPEFYLEDDKGKGYWFPCESLGTKSFGRMRGHRPIIQKGDNFKMPQKSERQRYVTQTITSVKQPGIEMLKIEEIMKVGSG